LAALQATKNHRALSSANLVVAKHAVRSTLTCSFALQTCAAKHELSAWMIYEVAGLGKRTATHDLTSCEFYGREMLRCRDPRWFVQARRIIDYIPLIGAVILSAFSGTIMAE
jgi:hypothetical protein